MSDFIDTTTDPRNRIVVASIWAGQCGTSWSCRSAKASRRQLCVNVSAPREARVQLHHRCLVEDVIAHRAHKLASDTDRIPISAGHMRAITRVSCLGARLRRARQPPVLLGPAHYLAAVQEWQANSPAIACRRWTPEIVSPSVPIVPDAGGRYGCRAFQRAGESSGPLGCKGGMHGATR